MPAPSIIRYHPHHLLPTGRWQRYSRRDGDVRGARSGLCFDRPSRCRAARLRHAGAASVAWHTNAAAAAAGARRLWCRLLPSPEPAAWHGIRSFCPLAPRGARIDGSSRRRGDGSNPRLAQQWRGPRWPTRWMDGARLDGRPQRTIPWSVAAHSAAAEHRVGACCGCRPSHVPAHLD